MRLYLSLDWWYDNDVHGTIAGDSRLCNKYIYIEANIQIIISLKIQTESKCSI